MKAAVMRSLREPLHIEEIAIDDPGPREVVVRTAATGVCHSDLHVLEGSLPSNAARSGPRFREPRTIRSTSRRFASSTIA